MSLERHEQFPHRDELVYLNHAGVGPWPLCTSEVASHFAAQNASQGSHAYMQWMQLEQDLKTRLAEFTGAASADEIALLKNTSEGLSVVAHGLDWQPGDNVVFAAEEFPSNRVVWESLSVYGVEARKVTISGSDSPEDALLAATDSRTRLLSVSAVQYASGLRMDLEKLGSHCHAKGILFCVDVIQQLGALEMDLQSIRADFAVADAHKWLLAPEGIAVFYCREAVRDQIQLRQFGWHMVEQQFDFDRQDWQPAASSRRFECGSPNMIGIHALHASLSLLQSIGMKNVSRMVLDNAGYLTGLIAADDRFEICSDRQPSRCSGIISFRPRSGDPQQMYESLMKHEVMCAARGNAVRFSPHFYHTQDELDHAFDILTTVTG